MQQNASCKCDHPSGFCCVVNRRSCCQLATQYIVLCLGLVMLGIALLTIRHKKAFILLIAFPILFLVIGVIVTVRVCTRTKGPRRPNEMTFKCVIEDDLQQPLIVPYMQQVTNYSAMAPPGVHVVPSALPPAIAQAPTAFQAPRIVPVRQNPGPFQQHQPAAPAVPPPALQQAPPANLPAPPLLQPRPPVPAALAAPLAPVLAPTALVMAPTAPAGPPAVQGPLLPHPTQALIPLDPSEDEEGIESVSESDSEYLGAGQTRTSYGPF